MASPEDNSGVEVDQLAVEEEREEEADVGEEEGEELLEGDGVVEEEEEENEEVGDENDEITDSANVAVEEEMADAGDDNPVGEVADQVEEGDEAMADEDEENAEEGDEETADDVDEGDDDIEDDEDDANSEKMVVLDETGSHTDEEMEQDEILEAVGEKQEKDRLNALVVYPLVKEDLDGPAIKPVLKLTKSFSFKFASQRLLPKEGVLDLRFHSDELREQAYTMLSGVKLRDYQPRLETSKQTHSNHYALLRRALEFVTKMKQEEEPAEPVSVFVNNIPLDARVEMLHFLYPSARSVQLPVNSQGGALGYAIVEFANLAEAQAVVKNNKEYPAGIGESYLNLHVIGHEEAREQEKPQKEQASAPKSQKRPAQNESSVQQNGKRLKTEEKTGRGLDKTPEKSSRSSERRSRFSDAKADSQKDAKLFKVFLGNCPYVSARKLEDFLNEQLVSEGICGADERPVKKALVQQKRRFQFVEIETAKYALGAIRKLNGIEFMGEKLKVQEGHNHRPLTKELELELEDTSSKHASRQEVRRSSAAKKAPPAKYFNVFVGNCPETTADELRDFLNESMAAEGICRSDDFPVRKTKIQKGRSFQFAMFCTAAYAVAAIQVLNLVKFKNTVLKLAEGHNDRSLKKEMEIETSRLMSARGHGDETEEATIFVGNCPYAKMEDYRDFFTKLLRERGICQPDEHVIKRIKRKKNRDFQFIVFYEVSHAIAAIEELDGVKFKGNRLSIKPANKIYQTNSGMEDPRLMTELNWLPDMHPGRAGGDDSNAFDVYVGNLPATTCEELEEFFRREFILRGLCHVSETPVKRIKFLNRRPFQFVVFRSASAAITAIAELDGVKFKGSKLSIQAGQNAPPIEPGMPGGPMRPKSMDLPPPDVPMPYMQDFINEAASNFVSGAPSYPRSMASQGMGMPSQGMGMLSQGIGMSSQGVDMLSQGMGMSSQGSGMSSQGIGMSSQGIGILPQGVGMMPHGVGMAAQVAGMSSRGADTMAHRMDTIPRGVGGASHHPDMPEDSRAEGYDVYIGNLPKARTNADEMELRNCIEYELVKRGICRATDRPILRMKFELGRVFQFAVFRRIEYARAAMEVLNGLEYKGMVIRVKEGLSRPGKSSNQPLNESRDRFPPSNRSQEHIHPPSGRSQDHTHPPSGRSQDHRSQERKVVPMKTETTTGFEVLVGNVPKCEASELKSFFMELLLNFGLCDEGDNPIKAMNFTVGRRYQFVKFRDENDAKAAVTVVNGREFKGKKLNVGMSQ